MFIGSVQDRSLERRNYIFSILNFSFLDQNGIINVVQRVHGKIELGTCACNYYFDKVNFCFSHIA